MHIEKYIQYIILILLISNSHYAYSQKGFAVLELYTSAGCSSCPPAEQLLPELKDRYKDNIYILEYHVDYWNRLGWKDQFSKAQYSDRQRSYTDIFNSNLVYTPQAIINGKYNIVGSRKEELQNTLDLVTNAPSPNKQLSLSAQRTSNSSIKILYNSTLSDQEFLYLALVQKEASVQVRAGENKGKLLKHHFIVRELKAVFGETGKKTINIPTDIFMNNCHIVAFIQNTETLQITAAKSTNIE